MICTIPDCENLAERSGVCASHSYILRKAEKTAKREAEKKASQKQIAKVSDKQAKELIIYAKKKAAHLRQYPNCQIKLVGCTNQNNTVHHTEKRGKNLNNEATFLTACDYCHDKIHFVLSAKENREKGLLKTI